MNSVSIIGNLVAQPELRYTPNGVAVANARIGVRGAGEWISEAEGYESGFFNIVVWGKQAENFAEYCDKGREVAIVGRLQFRTWDKDDNSRGYATEIVANTIDYLREPGGGSDQQEQPKTQGKNNRNQGNQGNQGRGGSRRGK